MNKTSAIKKDPTATEPRLYNNKVINEDKTGKEGTSLS
jgi:hypothetical protein